MLGSVCASVSAIDNHLQDLQNNIKNILIIVIQKIIILEINFKLFK